MLEPRTILILERGRHPGLDEIVQDLRDLVYFRTELLNAADWSHYEGGEAIARVDLLDDERPPGRRLAVRGEMQPKGLTLVERSGEEVKQPHLVRTDITGVFALQDAVFEEVNDRDALLLVESAHRGRGHGLREPRLDVVRQIRVLLRDLEEDGEVARAEAVPGVKEMGEERERRRLPQGQSVTQIWPKDNIEELDALIEYV